MSLFSVGFGNKKNIITAPIVEGRVEVAADTQDLFFVLSGKRIAIKDIFFVSTLPEALLEEKIYINTKDGNISFIVDGEVKTIKGLSDEQIALLKSTTNVRVSKDEPVQKDNVGDVWLIVEE